MIRVLVRAKSAIARAGLESLVRADARFEVLASRAPDLLRDLRELAPEVVLLDCGDEDPARGLPNFLHQPSSPAFVMLVGEAGRSSIRRVLQAGVRAMLTRDANADEIAAAVVAASCGLAVVSPEILDVLLPTNSEGATLEAEVVGEPLTARETEILALLAEGGGNREIASRLHISEHTVKFHVSAILAKLGAATRTEAVARGYREGLIVL